MGVENEARALAKLLWQPAQTWYYNSKQLDTLTDQQRVIRNVNDHTRVAEPGNTAPVNLDFFYNNVKIYKNE